jgi:hypothetical protein
VVGSRRLSPSLQDSMLHLLTQCRTCSGSEEIPVGEISDVKITPRAGHRARVVGVTLNGGLSKMCPVPVPV